MNIDNNTNQTEENSAPNPIKIAIMYDFDGTLIRGTMFDDMLSKELGYAHSALFWKDVADKYAREHDSEKVFSYVRCIVNEFQKRNIYNLLSKFKEYGKNIQFFPGVEEWFDNIAQRIKGRNVTLEHYAISSGLFDMINESRIGNKFRKIYASRFEYNDEGTPVWPKLAINYTAKTQYIFRINKGILDVHEDHDLNKYTPNHRRDIPFDNMIYIGDGLTDIPCMKMLKLKGGKSIAVYDPEQKSAKEACQDLQMQDRVQHYAAANFSEGSELYNIVARIVEYMIRTAETC